MDLKGTARIGYRFLSGLFAVCFLLAALTLGWTSGRFWAILIVAGGYWLFRRFPRIPRFTLWLFLTAFAVHLAWVLWLDQQPQSDFSVLYTVAEYLLRGDLSFNREIYFVLWSYQLPFVALEAALIRIWHDPMCIQIFNCLCAAGSVCLIYDLLRGMVRVSAARTAALCLVAFPTIGAMSVLLTNQCSSAFFLILGVWLVCGQAGKKLGVARWPLAGLAIRVGDLLRPEGVIVLVALLAYGVFCVVRHPQRAKQTALAALLLAAAYLLAGTAADQAVIRTGLSPYGVGNQLPQWKFVCGTNFQTNGGYAEDDFLLLADTLDEHHLPTEQTDEVFRELMTERLSRPLGDWAELLRNKLDRFWKIPGTEWAFADMTKQSDEFRGIIRPAIEEFDRTIYWLSLMLAMAGLLVRNREPKHLVCYFVFFAAFAAFLPIEVQPRYAYFPDFFLLGTGAFGLEGLEQCLSKERVL